VQRTCSIDGCDRSTRGPLTEHCVMHKERIRRYGDPSIASPEMAAAAGLERRTPSGRDKTCVGCQRTFRSSGHAKCDKCRRENTASSKSRFVPCLDCGTATPARRGNNEFAEQVRCDDCIAFRKAHRMSWLPKPPTRELSECQCASCGVTFMPTSCVQKYCKPECPTEQWKASRFRQCDACGKEYAPSNPMGRMRTWCSDECQQELERRKRQTEAYKEAARRHKDRRRARKRNAYVAPVSRKMIYERDKWICQLCGGKVHKNRMVPHPKAPVLDHVIPLACGGTHEPANVQLAHFLCNSIKSDRAVGEQLRLIG
jgi:hypothetical protein